MPFDVGFIELCVLLIVGLIVIGPDKLPVAARQLSKWFGGIRRHVNSFKSEVTRELEMDELRRQLESQKQSLEKVVDIAETQNYSSTNKQQVSLQMAKSASNKSVSAPKN